MYNCQHNILKYIKGEVKFETKLDFLVFLWIELNHVLAHSVVAYSQSGTWNDMCKNTDDII